MDQPLLLIVLAAILLLATPLTFNNSFVGAQENGDDDDDTEEQDIAGVSFNDTSLVAEEIADDLNSPTAMAFLDENRILVLEKNNGTVRLVEDGELQSEPVLDVAVANENERGMLGIAVSRENETTTYVFLYYTESGGGVDGDDTQGVPPAGNRLYRYELQGDQLVNPKLLLDLPALPGPRYNGGTVAIGPDDNVYVIIGDAEGHTTQAQNFEDGPAADGTSGILRVGKNGEIPEPVIGTGVFGKYYFAYGIRNSFGMAFDPETGMLWDTENGPAFGDEINFVDAGFNSGWRDVFGKANQTDLGDLVLFNSQSHYSDPEFSWIEPVGPTALAFLNSSQLGEEYRGDMFVGDINNGALYHFELNENRSALVLEGALADTVADTSQESSAAILGTGFGGITDIKAGPDGSLYILSYTEDTIYRIVSENPPEEDEDDESGTAAGSADLTVRSVNLSGDEIIGMFTTISSSNGTVLQEGYTPLTFTGDEGSEYAITAADFGGREFDHWDDETSNRTRTITLDQATSITAHYDTGSAANSQTNTLDSLGRFLNDNDCFDERDNRNLRNYVSNIIRDIFGDEEGRTDRLEQMLDRIIDDCVNNNDDNDDDDDNNNGRRLGNEDNNSQGNNNDNDNGVDVTVNGRTVTLHDSATSVVIRVAQLLDEDDCFNLQDRNRLSNALTNTFERIYADEGITQNRVDRVLDELVRECLNGNG